MKQKFVFLRTTLFESEKLLIVKNVVFTELAHIYIISCSSMVKTFVIHGIG